VCDFLSSDFGRLSDDNSKNKLKSEASLPQPKMPPSIFGCGNPTSQKFSHAAGGVGEKGIVCSKKINGSQAPYRTFAIILPNTIHGCKKRDLGKSS
jgi:hypothetical protein